MVKELLDRIIETKPNLAPVAVWKAYERIEKVIDKSPKNELTALVSLIRKVSGIDESLTSFEKIVKRNFQNWVFDKQKGTLKFNEEQMEWLRMIRDHIITSIHMDFDDLEYAPFDGKGGVPKMYQLFGKETDSIIDEINEALAA